MRSPGSGGGDKGDGGDGESAASPGSLLDQIKRRASKFNSTTPRIPENEVVNAPAPPPHPTATTIAAEKTTVEGFEDREAATYVVVGSCKEQRNSKMFLAALQDKFR